ncbi:hypothetical protein [Streptococcus dentiloxodontae]
MINRKDKDNFAHLADDLENQIIDNEAEEQIASLKLKVWIVLSLVVSVIAIAGAMTYNYVNQRKHYSQDELKRYVESLKTDKSNYDYYWSISDYKSLVMDESGETGTSLDDIISKYGHPTSTKVLDDLGENNRISINYDDHYFHGIGVQLDFINTNGTFRLYSKHASGLFVKGVEEATEDNYQYKWTKEGYQSLKIGDSWQDIRSKYGEPSMVSCTGTGTNISVLVSYNKEYGNFNSGSVTLSLKPKGKSYVLDSMSEKNAF